MANALWGAHCGKSARWVLRGGTGTRDYQGPSLPTRRIRHFPEGDKRRFGYSRDHRPDCVQIVIALVVTPEGLPLASDKTTLRPFLERIV